MKKWWKFILGVLIIAASIYAVYYLNSLRESKDSEAAKAETIVLPDIKAVDPKDEALKSGKSYFSFERSTFGFISNKLEVGDKVELYKKLIDSDFADSILSDESGDITEPWTVYTIDELEELQSIYFPYVLESLGIYEIGYLDENSVEIICTVDEYIKIGNYLEEFNENIIMVMVSDNV